MLDITVNGSLENGELEHYREYISERYPQVKKATVTVDGDYVDLDFNVPEIKFQRIQRITGYLTTTVDRWNDAKKAELKDRVKHMKV